LSSQRKTESQVVTDLKQAQQRIAELEARLVRRDAELREAQAELRDTRVQLQAVLDAITETAMILRDDGTVININRTGAERLGGTPEDFVGQSAFGRLPRDIAASSRELFAELVAHAALTRFEHKSHGQVLDLSVSPIIDDDGAR
jgi:PAS domain-containing protein